MIILKRNCFLGLQYYTISQTLITRRATHLRFVKLETLLNDAFNAKLTAVIHALDIQSQG